MSGWSRERLEVGDGIGFDRWRIEGPSDGPRIVVLGGVHGDETEGQLAAGRLTTLDLKLRSGSIDIVPVCNEAAALADSRTTPSDGVNLARVFPGDESGSITHRIAALLTREVLTGAALVIDLHTSGQHYDMPFLVGFRRDAERDPDGLGERVAIAAGADFLWSHPFHAAGRSLSVADVGVYFESTDGGTTNPETADRYVAGVLRAFATAGVLSSPVPGPATESPIRVSGGGDLDKDMATVSSAGLFIRAAGHGEHIREGDLLGRVIDGRGQVLESVVAPRTGWIMAMKRRSRVTPGEQVALVAGPETDV